MACRNCLSPARRLLHGARGATRALLGVHRAPAALIEQRRAICTQCPHAVPCSRAGRRPCWCGRLWDGIRGHHKTCGCSIPLKTVLRDESCPLGAW